MESGFPGRRCNEGMMLIAEAPQCVHAAGAVLGEGPVWVAGEQALYWLDIHGRRIYRYNPATGHYASWPTPFRIGAIAPRSTGGFVGGSERGFVLIDPDLRRFEVIADPEPDIAGNRFNDGKLDAHGRFWAGTMDDAEVAVTGALYRLDPDLGWARQDGGYAVPNGPTFSPDGRACYHTDSAAGTIYRFELDDEGELGRKSVFARFGAGDGHPDGMTTDADGCLWIAFWDGWCVRRVSQAGQVVETIELPVQRPTSCAFGGADLDRLFVTSARVGLDASALARQPLAGGLFSFRPGTRGLPSASFPA